MPYKLTRKVVSPTQKRVALTWYQPCDTGGCKGEYRVLCAAGRQGEVWIRCRDCNAKRRIKKPVGQHVNVWEMDAWRGPSKEAHDGVYS